MEQGFGHLFEHIELLEAAQHSILERWMGRSDVRSALRRNGIGPEFFGRHFGSRVIAYALGVVTGEQRLGNCPVIGVMLAIFREKEIPLADLFVVCVQLKNTFIDFALEEGILTRELFDEIASLLDRNFEGVIREYLAPTDTPLTCSIVWEKPAPESAPRAAATPDVATVQAAAVTSAAEYAREVEIDMEIIDELIELEHEAIGHLELYEELGGRTKEHVVSLFLQYARILNMMLEFQQLAFALNMLRELLEKTEIETLEASNKNGIVIYIKAIIDDLSHWRNAVFLEKSAADIHYLDKTLLSSIAQLEIMLLPSEGEDDDAIEFF